MFQIHEYTNQIDLTRGDTMRIGVTPYMDGEVYTPDEDDVIRFAMKKRLTDADVILEKVIPNDTMTLTLLPADTKDLDRGRYVYDIEITRANGDADTFISGVIVLEGDVK